MDRTDSLWSHLFDDTLHCPPVIEKQNIDRKAHPDGVDRRARTKHECLSSTELLASDQAAEPVPPAGSKLDPFSDAAATVQVDKPPLCALAHPASPRFPCYHDASGGCSMTDRRLTTRLSRFGILLLLLVVIGFLAPTQHAFAHAVLLSANPAPNSLLDRPPKEVALTFSEPVTPIGAGLTIVTPDGRTIRTLTIATSPEGTVLRLPWDANLSQEGTYLVQYRVMGRDGHLIAGHYVFSIGRATEPPPLSASGSAQPLLEAIARWLHLLGLVLIAGSVTIGLLGRGIHEIEAVARRLIRIGHRGLLLIVMASFLLISALFAPPPNMTDSLVLRSIAATPTGQLWSASFLVALAGYLLLLARFSVSIASGSLLLVGLALAVLRAAAGHAATSTYPLVGIVLATVHLVSAAVLAGGTLVGLSLARPLLSASDRSRAAAEQILRRFAPVALVCVELLTISGAYALWTNVADPAQLLTTTYGRILTLKFIVASIFGVTAAGATLYWFRRRAVPWSLLRLQGMEMLLLLILATGLVMLPPARRFEPSGFSQPPLTLAANAGPYLVTLSIEPALPGPNQLSLTLSAPNGEQISDAHVVAEFSAADGPRVVELRRSSTTYTGTIALQQDTWTVLVYVRRPGESTPPPARFRVPIPVPDARILLERADAAMNRLRAVEERTTLTSGGPVVETVIRYQAPDRAAYTVTTSGRPPTETIIIDDRRYDRAGDGPWTVTPWPGSEPFRWPNFRYARTAEEARLLGIESIDGTPCYVLSFYDPASETRYQMWIGLADFLVRRYEMMAIGHYMVGSFARFDDPTIVVDPPPLSD